MSNSKQPIRITQEKIEQAHEYMRMWIDQERWTDLNAALDHFGDTIYAAELLVSSGAINSENIKKYGAEFYKNTAYETELVIEALAKRFRKGTRRSQIAHITKTFKDCLIVSCDACNCVSFVPDKNEELYPELKEKCWECESKNIDVKRGIK